IATMAVKIESSFTRMGVNRTMRSAMELSEWSFYIDQNEWGEAKGWYQPAWDRSDWRKVTSPQAWDFYDQPFWGYEGVGWFATELCDEWLQADQFQRLRFNRVGGHAKVWINGQLA